MAATIRLKWCLSQPRAESEIKNNQNQTMSHIKGFFDKIEFRSCTKNTACFPDKSAQIDQKNFLCAD